MPIFVLGTLMVPTDPAGSGAITLKVMKAIEKFFRDHGRDLATAAFVLFLFWWLFA